MESRSVPTSVKVFGILHTVFGSFGLVTSPFNLLNLDQSLSVFQKLGVGAITLGWLRVQTFLAPIMAIILLVLGIGLLVKKSWARSGAVNFGYVQIALAVISAILTAIGFSSAMGANDSTGGAMAIGGMVGAIFGAVFGSIYPILTIIFMSKPNVKAALEGRE